MAQTVIGVFGSDSAAQAAVQNLLAVGVEREGIHIHTRSSEIEAMTHSDVNVDIAGTPKLEHESLLDKIERFFATLVGDGGHPPEFYHYREVVRRGGALVSVCVKDESQLPIVFTVFETSGARDIDEHAAQWQSELQEDASMQSHAIPEPGEADPAGPASGVSRQFCRVYPGEPPAAGSSPVSGGPGALQRTGRHP